MKPSVNGNEEEIVEVTDAPIDHKNMLVLAVATSIDALAVGITFAFLNTPIIEAISIIGITTFVLSIIGVIVGNFFGSKYKSKAEFIRWSDPGSSGRQNSSGTSRNSCF